MLMTFAQEVSNSISRLPTSHDCTRLLPDDAGWSSLVARKAHNHEVGGSNPPPATSLTGAAIVDDSPPTRRQIVAIEGIDFPQPKAKAVIHRTQTTAARMAHFPFPYLQEACED